MKKSLIVLFWITCLLGAFTLKSCAQQDTTGERQLINGNIQTITKYNNVAHLIADETWVTYSKTGAKIVTFSEAVYQDLSHHWGEEFKRVSICHKKDRHGPYKEHAIYLSQQSANNIQQWAKKNL